jgi:hypothetical protein
MTGGQAGMTVGMAVVVTVDLHMKIIIFQSRKRSWTGSQESLMHSRSSNFT